MGALITWDSSTCPNINPQSPPSCPASFALWLLYQPGQLRLWADSAWIQWFLPEQLAASSNGPSRSETPNSWHLGRTICTRSQQRQLAQLCSTLPSCSCCSWVGKASISSTNSFTTPCAESLRYETVLPYFLTPDSATPANNSFFSQEAMKLIHLKLAICTRRG